jgi:hypothetical protein
MYRFNAGVFGEVLVVERQDARDAVRPQSRYRARSSWLSSFRSLVCGDKVIRTTGVR